MLRRPVPLSPVAALAALAGLVALACSEAHADGASLYAERCASCHGADGQAQTPVGRALSIPAFEGKRYSSESIAKLLAESKSHESLAITLPDAELAALVAHLDTLAD